MIYQLRCNRNSSIVIDDDWASVTPWAIQKAIQALWNTEHWMKDLCWKIVKGESGKVYLWHPINDWKVLTIHHHKGKYVIGVWEKCPKRVIHMEQCDTAEQLADVVYPLMDKLTDEELLENMNKPAADTLVYAVFDQAVTDYISALDRADGARELSSIEMFLKEMNRFHLIQYAKQRHRQIVEDREKRHGNDE